MNNFELDNQCKTLAATKTNYKLAKELILLRESLPSVKADAVREVKNKILSGIVQSDHKYMIIEGGYCYVSSRSLDEYANKLERGEL